MREKKEIREELLQVRKETIRAENEIDHYGFKQDTLDYLFEKAKELQNELNEITDELYVFMKEKIMKKETPSNNYNYYYLLAYTFYHTGRVNNGNKPLSFSDYKERMSDLSVREITEINNLSFDNK